MTEPTTCTVPVEFLRGVIALCTQRGYSPENIEAWSKDDKWVADLWRQAEQMLAIAKWGTPAPVGVEPVAWAATSEDGDVEALGMNQSRRFDPPLYTHPHPPEGMAGWMPIETAPKGKNNVILLRQACGSVANGFWLAEAYAGNGSWIWPYVHKNPTHWIPAPPIASEAKGAGHA